MEKPRGNPWDGPGAERIFWAVVDKQVFGSPRAGSDPLKQESSLG